MTASVDFYLLDCIDELSRLKIVCRLTDKVQRLGHQIIVLTKSEQQSVKLDGLMWTFLQSSFLPHAIYDERDQYKHQHPVIIHNHLQAGHGDVLINLKNSLPKSTEYKRILEFIDQNETSRNLGREKYRAYKLNQHPIRTHNIQVQ